MYVPVGDSYRICGAENSWEVQIPKARKGVKNWEAHAWFSTPEAALRHIGDESLRRMEGPIEECVEEMKVLKADIQLAAKTVQDAIDKVIS